MKKILIVLLSAATLCLVSCNPKTEKAGEKIGKWTYENVIKAPKPSTHVVKEQCLKCYGSGKIIWTDYYGNVHVNQCDACGGKGFHYTIKRR